VLETKGRSSASIEDKALSARGDSGWVLWRTGLGGNVSSQLLAPCFVSKAGGGE
jgi:hypothetical protein